MFLIQFNPTFICLVIVAVNMGTFWMCTDVHKHISNCCELIFPQRLPRFGRACSLMDKKKASDQVLKVTCASSFTLLQHRPIYPTSEFGVYPSKHLLSVGLPWKVVRNVVLYSVFACGQGCTSVWIGSVFLRHSAADYHRRHARKQAHTHTRSNSFRMCL